MLKVINHVNFLTAELTAHLYPTILGSNSLSLEPKRNPLFLDDGVPGRLCVDAGDLHQPALPRQQLQVLPGRSRHQDGQ